MYWSQKTRRVAWRIHAVSCLCTGAGVSMLLRKQNPCLGFSCLDPETFNHAFSVLWRVWFLRRAAFGRSGERSRSLSGQARAGDCKWCPWAGFVYFLLYKTVNCHWPLPWEQHCRSLDDGLRFNEPMLYKPYGKLFR